MSVKVQLKHSATANKAPLATDLVDGELAININAASPAAYIKDSAGAVVKLAGAGSVSTPDATTTSKGIVQLADPAGIAAGTAGLVVDAAQLKAAQATAAGSTTAPAAPAAGKVWVNSGVTPAVINVWNGSSWIPQVGATVTAPAAPTAPAAGQVWVNTSVAPNVASIWDGTAWAAAAPDGAAAAVLANDAKYATKAELAVENLWDRTGTVLSPATAGDGMAFGTDGLVYDAATKRLGIGTASPGSALDVVGEIRLTASIATSTSSFVYSYGGGSIGDVRSGINLDGSNHAITFLTDQLERARIDSSGRLLVGTSSARSNFFNGTGTAALQVEGVTNDSSALSIIRNSNDIARAILTFAKTRGGSVGSTTIVQNGDEVGQISFQASDGTEFVECASILAVVDGTPGANDMPGRLVFSTTADGASSPTERMKIASDGVVTIKSSTDDITIGGKAGTAVAAANRCGIHFGIPSGVFPADGTGAPTDNACTLGLSSWRWSVVYAGTGTINTSDANLKQDVKELEQTELNVATAIKGLIKKFRFIDAVADKGEDARIHVGVIAQEVEQAFVNQGLDPRCYALFCEDTLEDGSKRLGIRYDELLAFVIAAL
jgi:hypothetical protein